MISPALGLSGSFENHRALHVFDAFLDSALLPLLHDTGVSPRMRAQLSRLATLLKASHPQQPDCWTGRGSPLPAFLHRLTALGRRDQVCALHSFAWIEAIVRRVVADGVSEVASFERGAEALRALARCEIEHVLRQRAATPPLDAVERVLKGLAGDTQLRGPARIAVEELLKPWLAGCHREFGPQSLQWQEACKTAALFFYALRPAANAEERCNKRTRHEKIMRRMEAVARAVPGAQVAAAAVLYWLEDHLAQLDADVPAVAAEAAPVENAAVAARHADLRGLLGHALRWTGSALKLAA